MARSGGVGARRGPTEVRRGGGARQTHLHRPRPSRGRGPQDHGHRHARRESELAAIAARRETEPAGMAGMARTVGTVGTMGTRASPSPGTVVNPAPASGWHQPLRGDHRARVPARAKAGADLRDSPLRPRGRPAGTTGTVGTAMMGSTGSTGTNRARSSRGPSWMPFGDGTRAFVRPSRSGPAGPPTLDPRPRLVSSWTVSTGTASRTRVGVATGFSRTSGRSLQGFDKVHATGPGCVVWCSRPTAELCRARLGAARAAPRGGCR